jgi:hypothetical protein
MISNFLVQVQKTREIAIDVCCENSDNPQTFYFSAIFFGLYFGWYLGQRLFYFDADI